MAGERRTHNARRGSLTRRVSRWVAVLLAVSYAFVAVGVLPSPAWLAGHMPNLDRFPCEGCGCGCATAKQCWEACCCHSDAEKLAWAMREGVEPPRYVTFSESTWIEALNIKDPGKAACALCVQAEQERLQTESSRRPSMLARLFSQRPRSSRCGTDCGSACCAEQARLSASTCGGRIDSTDSATDSATDSPNAPATGSSSARVHGEEAAPAPRGLPRFSPLRCKGVFELLIVLSHGVMHAHSGFYLLPSPMVELRGNPGMWASSRALPVDAPPPRAA